MQLQGEMTISDVRDVFNKKFPGLKLEFYSGHHDKHGGSPMRTQYAGEILLKDIKGVKKLGEMKLDGNMTVSEFESRMEKNFGLHVQVFRRSNQLWLQTSATDDWSLDKQNTKGLHSVVE